MSAAAWLEQELQRVVRKPLAQQLTSYPFTAAAQQFSSSLSMGNVHSNMVVRGGPPLTDADVRRLEHPNEFRHDGKAL